jgi:hypothetical protein
VAVAPVALEDVAVLVRRHHLGAAAAAAGRLGGREHPSTAEEIDSRGGADLRGRAEDMSVCGGQRLALR